MPTEIYLEQILDPASQPAKYHLIVLNQPIVQKQFEMLYFRASTKICADGGYSRLKHWLLTHNLKSEENEPDYIIGDFDSVDHENVPIFDNPRRVRIHDQNRTDLEKCIDYITELTQGSSQTFVIIGALGGRFDHELGSLSALYRYSNHRIIILNSFSMVTLINKGATLVHLGRKFLGPKCGFACLTGCARVSTTGFHWNIQNKEIGLGKFISESNVTEKDSFTFNTDRHLIFSIEISEP